MIVQLVLLLCLLTAAMSVAGAYLYFGVRRRLQSLEAGNTWRAEQLRTELKELSAELENVKREMELLERRGDPSAITARAFGCGSRIEALRLIKQGEGSDTIAGALGLPRTNVDLLIKMQRLQASPPPPHTA